VRYYEAQLRQLLKADKLVPVEEASSSYTIAQYDAIYSLGSRRNEVWIPLRDHEW
jgi:hypothetical protein